MKDSPFYHNFQWNQHTKGVIKDVQSYCMAIGSELSMLPVFIGYRVLKYTVYSQ